MSYLIPSAADLIAQINATNSSSITAADVTFGTPQATNGTWHGNVTTHNTAVKVTASASGKFQGSQSITYDRLDLASLAHVAGWSIAADTPTSVSGILQAIQYYNGIQFTTDDLVDSALTNNGDGTYSGTLTAKSTSLGWIGSFPITVKQGGIRLANVLTNTALNGLNYPTANDTDTYGPLYLYPYDFTTYYTDIAALVTGATLTDAQAATLVTDISAVDISSGKTLWNSSSSSTTWSLQGAVVTFNGLNGSDKPTNPAYKYVMQLTLRSGVTTPSGSLWLHYNDPVDPNAV